MITISAIYENGDSICTDFAGTKEDAIKHYLGNKHVFDYGDREEMSTCEAIMFHGTETDEIYAEAARLIDGEAWYEVNRDTGYSLSSWTIEDARKDYISEAHKEFSDRAFREAYGFYD